MYVYFILVHLALNPELASRWITDPDKTSYV